MPNGWASEFPGKITQCEHAAGEREPLVTLSSKWALEREAPGFIAVGRIQETDPLKRTNRIGTNNAWDLGRFEER